MNKVSDNWGEERYQQALEDLMGNKPEAWGEDAKVLDTERKRKKEEDQEVYVDETDLLYEAEIG